MDAKELRELSESCINNTEVEIVYNEILLPMLKKEAEEGERYLTLRSVLDSKPMGEWKNVQQNYKLTNRGYDLATYCIDNMRDFLKSKGFSYSLYSGDITIRW